MFTINCHNESEYISDNIKTYGVWEKYCSEVILELLRREDKEKVLFVDIGANIGYFSLLVAAAHGVKCLSFEPIEENYSLFEKSIQQNNFNERITLFKVALGEMECTKKFYISKNNMGLCSPDIDYLPIASSPRDIQVVPLDKYLELFSHSTVILKIDVEEAELEVLKGAEKVLSSPSVKYIVMEISKYSEELFEILDRHGFKTLVNIGWDVQNSNISNYKRDQKDVKLNPNTNYLGDPRYYSTVKEFQEKLKKDFLQSNILLIKDLNYFSI